ncbi:RNA 2',3'-cyclic phosphodiesterase [Goodfellowiella coeruleoviolacea]|uniref:RNA 2',3'-cyclic phosphodiesterase n=1 Tax=Goodfellowiella coeruleoviolacea TaxID=334858 RepID=UPI0020A341B0|nr:RNA 2',3'-cyclic phosphodiesterase [Goodfellowiella coeruleoviolacea]
MPRLFTALVPDDAVLRDLATALRPVQAALPEARWEPVERWHVTLCFHGQAEVADITAELRENARGLAAPTLRLAGAGTFQNPSGGVVWIGVAGVDSAGDQGLNRLAEASGADMGRFSGHLTVARWKDGRPLARRCREVAGELADYVSPAWTATDLVVMSSQLSPRGPRYTVEERVALRVP